MSNTIDNAALRVFRELLRRALAKKPTHIESIDILDDEPEDGWTCAWVYIDDPGEDNCFTVSWKSSLNMPDSEIRRLLCRNPLAAAR